MNSFGKNLRLTTFGESHGPAMGGVIDGLPSRFKIDFEAVQRELDRRKPGKNRFTTARREADTPRWLSGLTPDGVTLGSPVAFIIGNTDARSKDYAPFGSAFRPNHADFTYDMKYGIEPQPGGGRASARETVNWVAAGAIARQLIAAKGVRVSAALTQVGSTAIELTEAPDPEAVYSSPVYCPDEEAASQMMAEIEDARMQGDSVGGRVTCFITGLPGGIGDPIFDKLHARLAQAMMTINAAKGFEYGLGFRAAASRGSETADRFLPSDPSDRFLPSDPSDPSDPSGPSDLDCSPIEMRASGSSDLDCGPIEMRASDSSDLDCGPIEMRASDSRIRIVGNSSGGIQGGISNGQPVYFNVAFKPTPTLMRDVESVNALGEPVLLAASGRHDPCVAVRAVPVVEAMACLVIADFLTPTL